ncbi:MAG: hypothetical protein ACJATI_004373, partial [Halioglobus sp.]
WKLVMTIYNEILLNLGVDLDHFIRKIINDDNLRNQINGFADFLLMGNQYQHNSQT